MNILFVTRHVPGNLSYGGGQRVSLLYDTLRKIGDVYCIHFDNDENDSLRMRSVAKMHPRGWRHYVNAVWRRFYRTFVPMQKWETPIWMPCPYKVNLAALFPNVHFDCVVTRHYREIGAAHLWKRLAVFVDMDDHPLQVFETVFAPKMNPVKRTLSRCMMKMCIGAVEKHIEGGWVAREDQIKTVNFRKRPTILNNIPVTPPADYKSDVPRGNYIFTIGYLGYEPNITGIETFIHNIWPVVHEKFPTLSYKIVGKGLPPDKKTEWGQVEGVEVLGFVDDISKLYSGAMACVVPICSGSGTCIKTLESMAYSRICLSTPFGARGIPETDLTGGRTGVIIYNDYGDFVSALEKTLSDDVWRRRVESIGFEYVQANFGIDKFVQQVKRGLER